MEETFTNPIHRMLNLIINMNLRNIIHCQILPLPAPPSKLQTKDEIISVYQSVQLVNTYRHLNTFSIQYTSYIADTMN